MIFVTIDRNSAGCICGFSVREHGKNEVCAAVSLLTLNTVNSIEALIDEPFNCEYDPEGGYLRADLPRVREGRRCPEADLLLESMALGLRSVKDNYRSEIEIEDDSYD